MKKQSIFWMQSHVIQAPLTRIINLIPMFIDPKATAKEKQDISNYLVQSTNEMDAVVKISINSQHKWSLNVNNQRKKVKAKLFLT